MRNGPDHFALDILRGILRLFFLLPFFRFVVPLVLRLVLRLVLLFVLAWSAKYRQAFVNFF